MLPLRRMLPIAFETAIDLIYPPHCANCGESQVSGSWICAQCDALARRIEDPRCPICSRPLEGAMETFVCPNCHGHRMHLGCAVSVMRFEGVVRDLMLRFKYGREFYLRRVLGDWLAEAFEDTRLAGWERPVLVPVPLHPTRLRERKFNQSVALSEWVGRRLSLSVEQPLRRVIYTVTQTSFDRRERMRNLRAAFALRHNARVKDQSFLLVDDVLTTGSTLDECARVLLEGGARSVRAVTVARG